MVTKNGATVVPSIVPGSTVTSEITVELVKKGFMYTLQTVFQDLAVGTTTDILIDPTAVVGRFGVLYELLFNVTQGKANAEFYAGGTYSGGTPIYVANRNENSSNVASTIFTSAPTVSVLGTGGYKYVAGGEAQGNNLSGGSGGDRGFPIEINLAIPRLFRIVQSEGTGTYDLELRIVFAEII